MLVLSNQDRLRDSKDQGLQGCDCECLLQQMANMLEKVQTKQVFHPMLTNIALKTTIINWCLAEDFLHHSM